MKEYIKNPNCEMCGSENVYVAFHRNNPSKNCMESDICFFDNVIGVHMYHFCRNCKYEWLTLPLPQRNEQ